LWTTLTQEIEAKAKKSFKIDSLGGMLNSREKNSFSRPLQICFAEAAEDDSGRTRLSGQ